MGLDIETERSAEYEAAIQAHHEACAVYQVVRDRYRVFEIGDAEYLAARVLWIAAGKTFEDAFAKETWALRRESAAAGAAS